MTKAENRAGGGDPDEARFTFAVRRPLENTAGAPPATPAPFRALPLGEGGLGASTSGSLNRKHNQISLRAAAAQSY